MSHADAKRKTVLVTGFPVDVAKRQAKALAAGGDRVLLLAREKFTSQAQSFADNLTEMLVDQPHHGVCELLAGDISQLDLGLSGAQVRRLHGDIDEIYHAAAISYLGIHASRMRAVNVEGLRELLEFSLGCKKLQRLCLWSTAFVAGGRSGIVLEDELSTGQHFRNPYEQTKAEAEQLARAAMAKLPITIVRVPILVGESLTGEVDRLDGPYLLINAIVHAASAVPLPGRGKFPLPVVPVDFAVRAALALTRHPEAVGGTFHLVDEHPLTARAFFNAIADAAQRPRPTTFLPEGLAKAILNLPLVRGRVQSQRNFIEWFDTDVHFDNRRARALLQPLHISCPPVESYIDALVRHVRERT